MVLITTSHVFRKKVINNKLTFPRIGGASESQVFVMNVHLRSGEIQRVIIEVRVFDAVCFLQYILQMCSAKLTLYCIICVGNISTVTFDLS